MNNIRNDLEIANPSGDERKPVQKKVRFEVFKRDNFTCQYCGRKAPEVILHCDHIHPVAEGGSNEILNLVTACSECNGGKGARKLDDHHVIEKSRAQLEELNERRSQLEMLADWHRELANIAEYEITVLEDRWREISEESIGGLSARGRDNLKKWLRRFSDAEIMEAMTEAGRIYFVRGDDNNFEFDSVSNAFDMIPRIAMVRRSEKEKPYLRQLYYIRGILRNRLSYFREIDGLALLERAVEYGADLQSLTTFAKQVRSWSAFRSGIEQFIEEASHGTDS